MTSVQVVVDDRIEDDTVLHFEGEWRDGGVQAEFNSTTRATTSKGASNTLNFDGSSVQLFATQFDGTGILNLTYTIDSGSPTSVQLKENNRINYHTAFVKTDIPDGRHTLTTTLDDEGITLCMDYFLYTTTLERIVELKKPVTVLVDDTETSTIIYGGPWAATTTRTTAFGYTEHIASSTGANATFKFYGTYVGVFGTISPVTASSMYSIDNSVPAIYNSPQTTTQKSGQKLFEQTLDDGAHTLVITLRNDAEFGLDYITYKPSLSEAVYANPFPSPSTTQTSPSSPSESRTSSTTSSSNTGAIVGGVVGGVVALLAIALLAFFLLRKRKRTAANQPLDIDTNLGGPPANYPMPTNRGYSPVMTQEFDPLTLHPPSTVANSTYGASSSGASGITSWTNDAQSRAQDGGVRVLTAHVDEESLNPPAYHPNYPTSRIKN